jgi:cellulose biosynthesis protein BcsQ
LRIGKNQVQSARRLARVGWAALILLAVGGLKYWEWVSELVKVFDAELKVVGLIVGPALAVFGFLVGRVDKAEIKHLSYNLGEASERATKAQISAESAQKIANERLERVQELERDLRTVAHASGLSKLPGGTPFLKYREWKQESGAPIVMVGLFKGGVGKTHLAANLAAYLDRKMQQSGMAPKPILLIDLDYQGSLSTSVLAAADIEPVGSSIDKLFSPGASPMTLSACRIQLAAASPAATLGKFTGLPRTWIVPADYTLAALEGDLIVDRVLKKTDEVDPRFRLAQILLHPAVRNEYAAIIIDTPPRMTLGTVNAIVASHYLLMPAILDRISSEAVEPFLRQFSEVKEDLGVRCELAGFVGMMTKATKLSKAEEQQMNNITETIKTKNPLIHTKLVIATLPHKSAVTNSNDLAYFLNDTNGALSKQFYDPFFDRLWRRMTEQPWPSGGLTFAPRKALGRSFQAPASESH